MSNAERLIAVLSTVFPDGETEVDEALIERMTGALASITAPDLEVLMTGPDDSFANTHQGLDGLREAWADWLGAFGRIRFEVEGLEQIGDNVLTLGRQVGITLTGNVEIEQPSAAVWKFRGELIQRVEFHLDRDRALASVREPL